MTKKKTVSRAAPRRAPVAPPVINITQHIDARGISSVSVPQLPLLQQLLARHADKMRAEVGRLFKDSDSGTVARTDDSQTVVRFWKVGADGGVLNDTAKEWEGVYDASTRLIWGRKLLAGEHEWKDALKVAAAATLCGAPARAPTIQERLSIVDYGRTEPALDVSFFDPSEKNGWEWTSTPAAAPSGYAWGVYLGDGYSYRGLQSDRGRVRAVRAGQPIGFDF